MQRLLDMVLQEEILPYDSSKSDGSGAGKNILQAIEESGVAQVVKDMKDTHRC